MVQIKHKALFYRGTENQFHYETRYGNARYSSCAHLSLD